MTRFKGIKVLGKEPNEIFIKDKEKDYYICTEDEVCDLLNKQQVQIKVYKESLIRKSKKISEQQATISALKKENEQLRAKLREKEQDEQLYANEIVKLNKEAKEVLDFKSLGGDY